MAPLMFQEPATPRSLGGLKNEKAFLASDGIPPQSFYTSLTGAGEEGGEAAVARRLVSAASKSINRGFKSI